MMGSTSELPRISKEDMFAVMALWMERCPLNGENPPEQPQANSGQFGVNKAGAVFVDMNDRVIAMDCSRKRENEPSAKVHAVARVLIKFPDKVKGCTVYMSRKPCSFCVKLLIQAGVSRVRFLPFQPEASADLCSDLENAIRTENLVRVCPVGLSVYVPDLAELPVSQYHQQGENDPDDHCIDIKREYWSKRWQKELEQMKEGSERDIMRCSGLPDSRTIETVRDRMIRVGKWIGRVTSTLQNGTAFTLLKGNLNNPDDFPYPQELYLHLSRMALIALRRTDDPIKGVGVIILKEKEVVSVGMSGYPSKALFGDFPRKNAPKPAQTQSQQKYPYLVHAEQNAMLITNTSVIAHPSTTAFVTQTPCNDCAPLLFEAGVSNVVLPKKLTELDRDKRCQTFKHLYESHKINVFGIG